MKARFTLFNRSFIVSKIMFDTIPFHSNYCSFSFSIHFLHTMSKHIRRRSWFHSSSLLNMFTSSAPSSPEFRPNDTPCDIEGKHCHKPSFTSFLSKKRKQHSEDSSSCGSRRNSEQFSIFTEIIPTTNHPPLKFFKSDEDEADRLQLKNDLVKLAFDGYVVILVLCILVLTRSLT